MIKFILWFTAILIIFRLSFITRNIKGIEITFLITLYTIVIYFFGALYNLE